MVTRGGGTSVTGGLRVDSDGRAGVACLSLERMSGLVSVDPEAMTARVLGGTTGPELERALRPYGLTARHFPQSFDVRWRGCAGVVCAAARACGCAR